MSSKSNLALPGGHCVDRWRDDAQIPPVFYRTLFPLGRCTAYFKTARSVEMSRARVPLTIYCPSATRSHYHHPPEHLLIHLLESVPLLHWFLQVVFGEIDGDFTNWWVRHHHSIKVPSLKQQLARTYLAHGLEGECLN